ncbi:MAG: M56 family metallopeptidase [Gemmatimonadota bacterium]
MIAQWMVYGTAVAALLGLAALFAESVLVRWDRATRWVWAGSLGLLFAMPLIARVPIGWPGGQGEIILELGGMSQLSGEVASGSFMTASGGWSSVLLLFWIAASAGVALFFIRSHFTLLRMREEWRREVIDGHDVWVTPGSGPAVVGFLRPRILVPRWMCDLSHEERTLLLEHEAEHIRGRDMRLLLAGLIGLVAIPWNIALWWQVSRLRGAIEIDCDRRVLRRSASADSYGRLLLEVARRPSMLPASAAAFTTRISQLERRMVAMTHAYRGNRWLIGSVSSAAAALLLLASCGVEAPTTLAPDSDSPNRNGSSIDELAGEPTFTPYTVRPELTNRRELAAAISEGYPLMLRDAGIGGTPIYWVLIDESGGVADARVVQSSGREELDRAGAAAMMTAVFSPATFEDEAVPVWIQIPVTFAVASPAAQ